MISQILEARLIAAIREALPAAGLPSFSILGAWQTALAGTVKNSQTAANAATIAVAVSTPSNVVYTTATVRFSAAVALTVRTDRDATGSLLVAFAEPIDNLFLAWRGATYQRMFAALDGDGISCDDFSVGATEPPQIDLDRGIVTISWPLTITATITTGE